MTNRRRGVGQRKRSRARLGAASVSPVAGRDDPRWDRQRRARASDFQLGSGLRVGRHGRDEIAIGEEPENLLRTNARGELVVEAPARAASPAPAPVRVGTVSDPESADAIGVLQSALNRVQEILREQGLTT